MFHYSMPFMHIVNNIVHDFVVFITNRNKCNPTAVWYQMQKHIYVIQITEYSVTMMFLTGEGKDALLILR